MQGARPVRAASVYGPMESRESRATRVLFLLAAMPPHKTQSLSRPESNGRLCTSMRMITASSSSVEILLTSARPVGGSKAAGIPSSRRLMVWASTIFCKQRSSLLMVLSTRLMSANTLTSFGEFASLHIYAIYDVVTHHFSSFHRAIRGGGPSTWGIVTSITYKAHPAVPSAWVSIAYTATSIDDNYELVQNFVEKAPYWADLSGGAFINIYPTLVTFLGIIPNATTAELKKGLPILPAGSSVNYTEAPSFLSFFKETFDINNEV